MRQLSTLSCSNYVLNWLSIVDSPLQYIAVGPARLRHELFLSEKVEIVIRGCVRVSLYIIHHGPDILPLCNTRTG